MLALEQQPVAVQEREPVLDPVDRVSELCFGLFMALTFVGAVHKAIAGEDSHHVLFVSALTCNLAWGLADAVMYLMRTLTDRARRLNLARWLRGESDAARGAERLRDELGAVMKSIVTDAELERIRARMIAMPVTQEKPRLNARDFQAAFGIFVLVVLGTFPVALPFLLFERTQPALLVSRVLTLVLLFVCGLALGRHAGNVRWQTGFAMVVLGVLLTVAIVLIGG